jgi:hypothetical protein
MASVANIGQIAEQVGLPDGLAAWKRDVADYVEKKRNF